MDFIADVTPIRREIDATFTPWEKDPARIARLFLWLANLEEAPTTAKAIAAFIEDPTSYAIQYAVMCIFEHQRPEAA